MEMLKHRIISTLLLFAAYLVVPTQALAQCQQPDGNDTQPDTQAIQCLLNQGGTVVLDADVTQGYYIDGTLILTQSGTTLTSSSAFGNRALLVAVPNLGGPMLLVDNGGVSGYTISKIWFYGDRYNRINPSCSNGEGVNVRLRGSGFTIDNIESDAAACNSGLVLDGSTSNFEIKNSWFANNGWPEGSPGHTAQWADGLTLNQCVNGNVHDNNFVDNTDIDLVTGGTGGTSCLIQNNHINHYQSHAFGGIHVGWFPGENGNHSGLVVTDNTVSSTADMLAFGIIVGYHPWGLNPAEQVQNAGFVSSNTVTGAVVNVAVDGIPAGTVTGNSYSGAQGSWGYNCNTAANYAAGHFDGATVDGGYVSLVFDPPSCYVP